MVGRLKDLTRLTLPTTQPGRYPRPRWYNHNFGDRAWLEMCNEPGFLESYTDAVRTVILDQERSGLDVVTDGCIRYDPRGTRLAAWDTNNLVYMGGGTRAEGRPQGNPVIAALVGREVADAFHRVSALPTSAQNRWVWWNVTEEPSVGNLGNWLETFKVALPNARKPLKFSGPSAAMCGLHSINRTAKSDRDIYFQFFRVQNRVLRAIANAGCKVIQLDYPFAMVHWAAQFRKIRRDVWKDLVDAFNEEVRGVNAQIWVHFCFGAPILYSHETPPLRYHMADVYPNIAECRADCIQSEAANTDGRYLDRELKAWRGYLSDRDYAVGAVTPYDLLETAEDVEAIVKKALRYVPPEKLALTADEGIAGNGFMTRDGAMIKMRLLSEAAKKLRKDAS